MDEDRLVKRKHKAQRDGNVVQLAQVAKELGDLYFETGRERDALQEYSDQLTACEVLNRKLDCAIAHRMIGEVHASLGNYDEALTHQMLHLEGAREADNALEQQRALATIGRTHFCRGEVLPEKSTERIDAFAAAKKAYSKSLRLCDDLEKTNIPVTEMMTMRARLLLNLGLVLEEQKEPGQAIELIEKAAELCKKYKLHEDLHRTHLALAALHERQDHFGLAIRQVDEAIEAAVDSSLKAVGRLAKVELLLRLGHWSEARQILISLYLSKDVTGRTSQQVEKFLRIAVTICRAEESLEVERDPETCQNLYERLGDASVAVRSYDKAVEYYRGMLSCAEENARIAGTEQVSAALVSLVQTLRDTSRYAEALPYARRELDLCIESTEICRSAMNLADLLHLTGASKFEVMKYYEMAIGSARKSEDRVLEASVIKDVIIYLEDIGSEDVEEYRKKLGQLPDVAVESAAASESESENASNIGAEICLEDLSDVEAEMRKKSENLSTSRGKRTKRSGLVVKRNDKGETKLHVACINGYLTEVEKLLAAGHPTNVKDHCGWTPLHEASNHGFVDIARLLIEAGANIDDPGGTMCGGVTPIHDAASCGNFAIIRLLMKHGANLTLKTREGDSVLDCLEGWRNRVESLPSDDEAEFENLRDTLEAVVPRRDRISRDKTLTQDDLTDVDEPESNVERISAGEDYRRTIENLKNRGRPNVSKRGNNAREKIVAPLLDDEQMVVDDWLEDDLDCTVKEKSLVEDSSPTITTNKRKSKSFTPETDKITKRPRVKSSENERVVDDLELESNDSSDFIFDRRIAPKNNLKKRQLSLLKTGFTKDLSSRTPSPLFNYSNNISNNYETSELVKLIVRMEEKLINLKLRFPEQREATVASIMNDVIEKFEDETGCRAQITLTTMSGEILLADNTLRNVRPVDGVVRLVADIVENEIPSIVDRYSRICGHHQIQSRSTIMKCLKICDSTSTFRVKSGDAMDDEIVPLLKCLEYQDKLQILQMSGASLYETGDILNQVLKRLKNLQELHLQGCDIDDNCLLRLETLPSQLRILDLSYNPLGSRCQRKLYDLVSHHRHLQTLNLRFCKLTNFPSSDRWTSLVNLDLSWNPLEPRSDVSSHLLRRQMLSLNLSNTCDTIPREILDSSTSRSMSTLETLELSCCELRDSDIGDIAARAVNLSKLVVSGNSRLTKTAIEMLLRRKPSLTEIEAGGCSTILEAPASDVHIDNPRICKLTVSMSSEISRFWLRLWRGSANTRTLPHDLITFQPIVIT